MNRDKYLNAMEEKSCPDILKKSFAVPLEVVNKRGRPKKQKEIRFSSQPKSIVSQLLCKLKANQRNIAIDTDSEQKSQDCEDVQDVEEVKQNKLYTCTFCTYRSEDVKEQHNHLKTHKQFVCDYPNCSYSCKLSSNLTKHKRIHTGEKPYLCDQCSFRSNFINSLKVHKRTHTMERPYACKDCSYRSSSSWNLKKHCFHRHLHALKTG